MTQIAVLRARLLVLRDDALARRAAGLPVVDTGMLRIVADTGAVLAALEVEADLATSPGKTGDDR